MFPGKQHTAVWRGVKLSVETPGGENPRAAQVPGCRTIRAHTVGFYNEQAKNQFLA